MKRVLIADNHPLMRDAVKSLLMAEADFEVVGEVGDADSCLFQIDLVRPDIVILDLNMPGKGGFRVLSELRDHQTRPDVHILSMYSGREFVARAQDLGARGFVAKEDVGHELLSLLRSTVPGFVMSSSAGTVSAEEMGFGSRDTSEIAVLLEGLTHTERKVLKLLADSKSSAQVSDALGVSLRTIHTHRQNIRQKLDLTGANALVVFASRNRAEILAADP